MIAVRERVLACGGQPERWVWHTPSGPTVVEYQAIACSDEYGLAVPSRAHDVPLQLDSPEEAWCRACLALTQVR